MMGNGYWEWIIGEWSLTCFIGDRSLTWRTKISFRRINFPSSTSLPWKVAPSRSSSPPHLSHHLVCLSHNLVCLSQYLELLSHHSVCFSHNLVCLSHHLVCLSYYLVHLSHHLVRLSHDFARLSSQHLVRLSPHLVRFIHYLVRLSQNLAHLSDYLVHFLSLSRHLKCLHTFFLPLSHLFICPPYGTSRSKPHIKWNYVQECSHRLFCFFNKASWKESHWGAQPRSRYCRMSESANKI